VVHLVTDRLVLRTLTLDDVANIVELDADPAVREFLDPDETTEAGARAWLISLAEKYPPGSTRGFWAAEEGGRFIGWFHLRPAHDTGECELGYRLRRQAWGRGLATEGSRALLELANERVIARTMIINRRSRRVMEKLGMTVVREFPYHGFGPNDEVEYAIDPTAESSRPESLADPAAHR